MKIERYLAKKILLGKKQSKILSFLSWMAILGVGVSCGAFFFIQAVMGGFFSDIQKKVIGFNAHLVMELSSNGASQPILNTIQKLYPEAKLAFYQEAEGILQSVFSEGDSGQGVYIRAIDLAKPGTYADMNLRFYRGLSWEDLGKTIEGLPTVIVGEELANQMGLAPELLEEVDLIYPFSDVDPSGEAIPSIKQFRLIGTFRTGYLNYDGKYLMVSAQNTKSFFEEDLPWQVALWFPNPDQAPAAKKKLAQLPELKNIQTWQEMNTKLFHALKLERLAMQIVLVMMVVFASFNIVSMLTLMVAEYFPDIAVWKSLGLPSTKAAGVFKQVGLFIGIVGSCVGLILGWGAVLLVQWGHIQLPQPYDIETLPAMVHLPLILITLCLGPVVSMLAAILPARQTARLNVMDALRYE
ncbi:MAG: ABC transporter permease [Deltaproteobacteria bacterium]|nr:ABC transporter permease [Deltaproteobacteria bacterium]